MKVVAAVDSFKGCMTSAEANQAVADGVSSACEGADIIQVPVSDGGEGFLEAFHAGIGGDRIEVTIEEGDVIRVVSGVWKDTVAPIRGVNQSKQSVTINVELFGRETPVEISFAEIRKM